MWYFRPFSIPEGVYDQSRLLSLEEYENRLKKGLLKRNTIHPKFCEKKEEPKVEAKVEEVKEWSVSVYDTFLLYMNIISLKLYFCFYVML